jgi:hypothetical protein
MKLIDRFIRKPSAAPPTLEERMAMLDAASAEHLAEIALGDDEPELRTAAVQRLGDGEVLRSIAGLNAGGDDASNAEPAPVQQTAQARLSQLIDANAIDFAQFCADAPNHAALFAIVALCQDTDRLPQAFASIADRTDVARWVIESPPGRLRQLAAEAVTDPAQIRELLKLVRNKDKAVYRILKQKADELAELDRKTAEIANDIEAQCAALERHSHRSFDVFYIAAFERLEARWCALVPPPVGDVSQRAEGARAHCRSIIEAHQRQIAEQAAHEAAQQAARDARVRAEQEARAAALAQAEIEARLHAEAAARQAAEEAQRDAARAQEEQLIRQIGGLLRHAHAALSEGNTKKAAGLRRTIEEKWASAPAAPPHLARQLQRLDDQLRNLKGWKDYAVAPKRAELIAAMESLVASTDDPQKLAERIKGLQQEWRTISQGLASEAPAEWERFHQAAQAAYRPCREYFEAQAALRRANLDKRATVLERLMAFEKSQDGENPDWLLMSRVVREAPEEWQRPFPVERDAIRALQHDFTAALKRLQSRLDTWYERNIADKQALIKRAHHVLTQDDGHEATETLKRLQTQWKETGPVPHSQSQSLWNEFREACDAVYQKRQQAQVELAAGFEAAKAKIQALCEEAERLAALTGAASVEAGARIAELRTEFDALAAVPRGLQDRFERALHRHEAQLVERRRLDGEEAVMNLFSAARHVRECEWATARDAPPTERQAVRHAAEAFIAGVRRWPKGGLQTVKELLARVDSPSTGGISGEKALRLLCIRAEILSDTPTPAEDDALRREYQVQRLMQGMGQGSRAVEGDWDALVLEWVRSSDAPPLGYEALQSRFMRSWAKRPVQPPRPPVYPVRDREDDRKRHDVRDGYAQRRGRDGSRPPHGR